MTICFNKRILKCHHHHHCGKSSIIIFPEHRNMHSLAGSSPISYCFNVSTANLEWPRNAMLASRPAYSSSTSWPPGCYEKKNVTLKLYIVTEKNECVHLRIFKYWRNICWIKLNFTSDVLRTCAAHLKPDVLSHLTANLIKMFYVERRTNFFKLLLIIVKKLNAWRRRCELFQFKKKNI